jgi:hypothetical protein
MRVAGRVVVLDLAGGGGADAHLVFDAADLDGLVLLDEEHRETAGVRRAFLAAGEDDGDVGQAVGDEALDAVEGPLAGGFVERRLGRHGAQIRAGIGFGQDHRAGNLAA